MYSTQYVCMRVLQLRRCTVLVVVEVKKAIMPETPKKDDYEENARRSN